MLNKLASRGALYGLAPQISRIAGFFALPIITQYLTPLDYGNFGTIAAYLAGFGALQYLGTNIVFSNAFFKSPNHYKWLWRQLHGFLSLWALVYALLLGTVLYFILPAEAASNRWTIIGLTVVPAALIDPTLNLTFRYYHLTQQALTLAIRTAIVGLLTVALNIFTIAYLKLGYMGWFWSFFISNCVSFILFFYPIYFKHHLTPIFNFKIQTIKRNLKISVPAIPHYYSTYLLQSSDRVVMHMMGINIGSIGIYNIGSTFGGYYQSFSDAVGTAAGPMYLQYYRDATTKSFSEARKMTFVVQAFFLLLSVGICIWIKEIFELLVKNEELQAAYPLAIIILMSYNYRPMYLAVTNKLIFQEKTGSLWKISFAAGVLNVVLNLIFLPIFGITGAAVITFVSFMYIGYSGFFMKEYKEIKDLDYKPVFWLMSTLAALLFAYFFVEASFLVKFAFSLLCLLVAAVFLYIHFIAKTSSAYRSVGRKYVK